MSNSTVEVEDHHQLELARVPDPEPDVLPQVEAVIEAVADEVAGLIRGSELRCAFEVGRVVAERLYDGDPGGWHRCGPKSASMARLAHALAVRGVGSASALRLCLGVFETLEPLGREFSWKCLTRGHVRAVLPLPTAERVPLLRKADEAGWTIRELETSARKTPKMRRVGRPRQPAFIHGIRQVLAVLAPDALAFKEWNRIRELSPEAIAKLHIDVMSARARLDRLQVKLSPKHADAVQAGLASD